MKHVKSIVFLLAKTLTISICGVISLSYFLPFFPMILKSMHPFQYGHWIYIYYSPLKYTIGFVLCFIFGLPSILILEKWFPHVTARYLFGGAIASAVAFSILEGGIYAPSIWEKPWGINWQLGLFFIAYGIATGALYTFFIFIIRKIKLSIEKIQRK